MKKRVFAIGIERGAVVGTRTAYDQILLRAYAKCLWSIGVINTYLTLEKWHGR